MSLIHDALKKAQEKDEKKYSPLLPDLKASGEEGGRKAITKRTIVLMGVLLLAMLYTVYDKFVASGEKGVPKQPEQALKVEESGKESGLVESESGRLSETGVFAYKKGNLEDALGKFSAASQIDPNNHEVWNNLGVTAKKKGDYSRAREAYEKALFLNENYSEAMNNLAALEIESGNLTNAKALLEKALKISPDYPEANFHMGVLCEKEKRTNDAVMYYKNFLDNAKDISPSLLEQVREHVFNLEP